MKWALLIAAALLLIVLVVVLIGALLPKGHVASRTARYAQPPQRIWDAVSDHAAQADWRPELKSVERVEREGRVEWREVHKRRMVLPIEDVEVDPPRRLVGRIADPRLPFGGT